MANRPERQDLILLVADSNQEHTVKGLLSRPQALGIRKVRFNVARHPERDPGCLLRASEFLRPFRERYHHAMVLLDREGSGREGSLRRELERELEERLTADWDDRAAAIVLDPELEIWLWSDSPHVDDVLGWQGRSPDLRSFLVERSLLAAGESKPSRPKEALEKVLRSVRKPRSSALYKQLAERVSFKRCVDPAFQRFCKTLQGWYPDTVG